MTKHSTHMNSDISSTCLICHGKTYQTPKKERRHDESQVVYLSISQTNVYKTDEFNVCNGKKHLKKR